MAEVKALGYIGCHISDPAAWKQMLEEIFALELRADGDDSVQRYRMDEQHHRLALYESDRDALSYVGWAVETRQDLDDLAASLIAKGIEVERGDSELCAERSVMDLIVFEGPDAVRTEVFFGPVTRSSRSHPSAAWKDTIRAHWVWDTWSCRRAIGKPQCSGTRTCWVFA